MNISLAKRPGTTTIDLIAASQISARYPVANWRDVRPVYDSLRSLNPELPSWRMAEAGLEQQWQGLTRKNERLAS